VKCGDSLYTGEVLSNYPVLTAVFGDPRRSG
jgi:hypothetical protein